LSFSGIHAGIRLRPNEADLKTMSPEFDRYWTTYFEPGIDKPVMLIATFEGQENPFIV